MMPVKPKVERTAEWIKVIGKSGIPHTFPNIDKYAKLSDEELIKLVDEIHEAIPAIPKPPIVPPVIKPPPKPPPIIKIPPPTVTKPPPIVVKPPPPVLIPPPVVEFKPTILPPAVPVTINVPPLHTIEITKMPPIQALEVTKMPPIKELEITKLPKWSVKMNSLINIDICGLVLQGY